MPASAAVTCFRSWRLGFTWSFLHSAAVCRYGAVLVLQAAMTLGDLNAFMLYAIYVAGSAGGLAGTAAQVIAAVSSPLQPTGCQRAAARAARLLPAENPDKGACQNPDKGTHPSCLSARETRCLFASSASTAASAQHLCSTLVMSVWCLACRLVLASGFSN